MYYKRGYHSILMTIEYDLAAFTFKLTCIHRFWVSKVGDWVTLGKHVFRMTKVDGCNRSNCFKNFQRNIPITDLIRFFFVKFAAVAGLMEEILHQLPPNATSRIRALDSHETVSRWKALTEVPPPQQFPSRFKIPHKFLQIFQRLFLPTSPKPKWKPHIAGGDEEMFHFGIFFGNRDFLNHLNHTCFGHFLRVGPKNHYHAGQWKRPGHWLRPRGEHGDSQSGLERWMFSWKWLDQWLPSSKLT